MEKNQKATLGCGTLILIALIVVIFGNMAGGKATEQIRGLQTEVKNLHSLITMQTEEIRGVQTKIQGLQTMVSTQTKQIEELKTMVSKLGGIGGNGGG